MVHVWCGHRGIVGLLLAAVVCVAGGCICVPETSCSKVTEVDLRLDAPGRECPRGMQCCDVDGNQGTGQPFCDGECRPDPCEGDEAYDEYGADQIDVRTASDGTGCPPGRYCCRTRSDPVPICNGTCVPRSLCTMFVTDRDDGCSGGNVCCGIDRTLWIELINDINEMVTPESRADRGCRWSRQPDGSYVPPWLVSVWARLEIIPGLDLDQYFCGGVVVDPTTVLTTASCVAPFPTEELFVNVGDHDISSRSALRMDNIFTVEKTILHEDYNSSRPGHRDVALLRLAGTVPAGKCAARFATSSGNACPEPNVCSTIGWNRELLATKVSGRPQRVVTPVVSFREDLFCAPGTICLQTDAGTCDGDSLQGSAVVCEEGESQESWTLAGLMVGNCTGVAVESIAEWVKHQQGPRFVQESVPTDPSRRYLPVT